VRLRGEGEGEGGGGSEKGSLDQLYKYSKMKEFHKK